MIKPANQVHQYKKRLVSIIKKISQIWCWFVSWRSVGVICHISRLWDKKDIATLAYAEKALTKCSILFRMIGKTLSSLISTSELHLSIILMLSLSPKGVFLLCPLAHLVIFWWKSDVLYLVSAGNRNEHSEVFCQYRWVLDFVSSFLGTCGLQVPVEIFWFNSYPWCSVPSSFLT